MDDRFANVTAPCLKNLANSLQERFELQGTDGDWMVLKQKNTGEYSFYRYMTKNGLSESEIRNAFQTANFPLSPLLLEFFSVFGQMREEPLPIDNGFRIPLECFDGEDFGFEPDELGAFSDAIVLYKFGNGDSIILNADGQCAMLEHEAPTLVDIGPLEDFFDHFSE